MTDPKNPVHNLVIEYEEGHVSRRDFMRRALALGLSVSAIGGLLAAARPARVEAQEPRQGGILREGYDLEPSRMDPINTNWYDPGFFALYDAIVTSDPEGKIVPQIAESWEFSADSKAVTFRLRPGLKFHSGRPLTAQTIKEVYDTVQNPDSGSPLRILFDPVEHTEAVDDTTLVLHLKQPYAEILEVAKTGFWRIANMETRTRLGEQYGQREIDGSGPFTFQEWVPGSHVSVKRWEDYPGSIVPYFQNKGKAYLDGVRWVVILEAAQRGIQIETGEIDALHSPAPQDVPRLEANPDLNVIKLREWSGYILSMNREKTDLGFDDVRVRKGLSHAINRPAIVRSLLFGEGEPLYGPWNSADRYYTKEVEKFSQFDQEKARSLLDEAGWKVGGDGIRERNGRKFSFNMVIQAESFNKDLAAALQAQFKDVGAEVKIEAYDRGTYFAKMGEGPDTSIFFYLWPVPMDVVVLFVSSKNVPFPNWTRVKDPVIDEAISAWQHAANDDELRKAAVDFQLRWADDLPYASIVNRNNIWVHRKNVHGWVPHQWNLYPYYNDVWLEA